jgi:hypothetical protein
VCSSDLGVAAWQGKTLSLLSQDQGATLYSGTLEAEILDARMDTQYAAAQVGTEHSSVMLIMEHGGRQVDRIELANQTVLDFGFFYSGSLFWVKSMDTGHRAAVLDFHYKPGIMLAGTITDTQQVLYEVLFQSAKIGRWHTHIKTSTLPARIDRRPHVCTAGI